MSGFLQNIFDNPILTRELRRRMRGRALIFSIIGYIIIMTITSILILISGMNPFDMAANSQNNTKLLEDMVKTGTLLFNAITVIQALLVLIIAPTITAGMTTVEKERQTFDFLRVTTITPWMYILGCFLSTIFYVSLALLCALPLLSLSFLYGGVSQNEVIERTITLMGMSMVLSALGLYISSIRERTRTAQGIVVFLIFFLIFGGIILESTLTTRFGSGLLTGGGGAQIFSVLGLSFTQTNLLWGVFFFMSTIFLLMATRKLFDPFESRSVNHWQFAVIFTFLLSILLASGRQPVANIQAIVFVSVGGFLLAFAALNFAVGRMEVGDEMWHLKRLLPFLRYFDQTIPYLIIIGAVWYWAAHSFVENIPLSSTLSTPKGILWGAEVAICGFLFFCTFARLATAYSIGRKQSGRWTLGVIIFSWLLLPVVCLIMLSILDNADITDGFIVTALIQFSSLSPFYVVVESMINPDNLTLLFTSPAIFPCAAYIVFSCICLLVGEPKRLKRWKGFSWHYDMPSA
ncbi:MAG: ABC transporter permease subunit [Sumerlaeia bacterium]